MDAMVLFVWLAVVLVIGGAFAAFGAWVAREKGRDPSTGAVIGACFGPLGLIILALLPTVERRQSTSSRRPPAGASRKSRLTAWDIPDDWEPTPEPPARSKPERGDDDEDRALRYLSEN